MGAPLLHRLPSTGRYDRKYRVHGFDHLLVQAEYSDEDFRRPQFMYWAIYDTRFTPGLDRWSRGNVLVVEKLGDVRSWIQAGGPQVWDPEMRKTDKKWRPLPDGWSPDEQFERPRIPKAAQAVGETAQTVDLRGKRFAVCPGYVRSTGGGQRHFINFDALTWLYGVNPAECILMDEVNEKKWNSEAREKLIWLYPQDEYEGYLSMREELERGDDAFKLVEP